jgi:hypothetical protein
MRAYSFLNGREPQVQVTVLRTGLYIPRKGLLEINDSIKDLAGRARAGMGGFPAVCACHC